MGDSGKTSPFTGSDAKATSGSGRAGGTYSGSPSGAAGGMSSGSGGGYKAGYAANSSSTAGLDPSRRTLFVPLLGLTLFLMGHASQRELLSQCAPLFLLFFEGTALGPAGAIVSAHPQSGSEHSCPQAPPAWRSALVAVLDIPPVSMGIPLAKRTAPRSIRSPPSSTLKSHGPRIVAMPTLPMLWPATPTIPARPPLPARTHTPQRK